MTTVTIAAIITTLALAATANPLYIPGTFPVVARARDATALAYAHVQRQRPTDTLGIPRPVYYRSSYTQKSVPHIYAKSGDAPTAGYVGGQGLGLNGVPVNYYSYMTGQKEVETAYNKIEQKYDHNAIESLRALYGQGTKRPMRFYDVFG